MNIDHTNSIIALSFIVFALWIFLPAMLVTGFFLLEASLKSYYCATVASFTYILALQWWERSESEKSSGKIISDSQNCNLPNATQTTLFEAESGDSATCPIGTPNLATATKSANHTTSSDFSFQY